MDFFLLIYLIIFLFRYPKFKINIEEIVEEIIDLLFKKKNPSLIGLYSITDSSYRIIL